MKSFGPSDLDHEELYFWRESEKEALEDFISGSKKFNRSNGFQVLYLLNKVMFHLPNKSVKEFKFLEDLLIKDLNTTTSGGKVQALEDWFVRKFRTMGILEKPKRKYRTKKTRNGTNPRKKSGKKSPSPTNRDN